MTKAAVKRREFLQLANVYNPEKDKIGGWYVSEKLDGTRCFWDGGITRGMPTDMIPWASVKDPKTGQTKKKIKPESTGLWSRYGNPIIAPEWFLDALPKVPLDGELWAGRGKFQLCRSICGGDTPDLRFELIQYAVYGGPSLFDIFADGEIKNANFHCKVNQEQCITFCVQHAGKVATLDAAPTFDEELCALDARMKTGCQRLSSWHLHKQVKLPEDHAAAKAAVEVELAKVVEMGGEGVMLRAPTSVWTPKRVKTLLKYKPYQDDEAKIVGFTAGRETDKGSKHLGKIGAIITEFNGKRLELSGLTDEEREFSSEDQTSHAKQNPGEDMPSHFTGRFFKPGQRVTFKYRELTDDGIPKEASYFRPHSET